jgi:Fic family protein
MDIQAFTSQARRNIIRTLGGYYAYVPPKLPPKIGITWALASKLSEADRAVSQLAGIARTLPNPHLLIDPFMRREAVLSSRIEGTQASLSDLFAYEASPTTPSLANRPHRSDVQEVHNYVMALDYGLTRLNELPISSRLICEMHERLMQGVRGESATPGQFRSSQNWIGPPNCLLKEATYVPPPVDEMHRSFSDLERFLNGTVELPPLVVIAIAHYQFEAIHPFLDGNGRIGRLLLVLLLCTRGVLPAPLLYLSAYFEQNRTSYYDGLLSVSQKDDWVSWITFFLKAVTTQSNDAVLRSNRLVDLQGTYRARLLASRASSTLLRLIDHLFTYPAITLGSSARFLECTPRTAQQNIDKLLENGILNEVTGRQRNRIFMATEIVQVIDSTEPQR